MQRFGRHIADQSVTQNTRSVNYAIKLSTMLGNNAHGLSQLHFIGNIGGQDNHLVARSAQACERFGRRTALKRSCTTKQNQSRVMTISKMLSELQTNTAETASNEINTPFIEGATRHPLGRSEFLDYLCITPTATQRDKLQAIAGSQLAHQLLCGRCATTGLVKINAARIKLGRFLCQ